jgi:hypothetical protein
MLGPQSIDIFLIEAYGKHDIELGNWSLWTGCIIVNLLSTSRVFDGIDHIYI